MRMTGNTILITGGASGIGLGLAKRLAARGNKVIAAGRRPQMLAKAAAEVPGLETVHADISTEAGRSGLVDEAARRFPALNVLINNAGIQQRPQPITQTQDWSAHKAELATNLEAPLHLTMLMIPQLMRQPHGEIINVTSGLAFAPLALMPTYCLTKAALRSFTLSLRHQLRATNIGVTELIPPAVNTDLGGPGLHTFGVNLDEFCDHCMTKLEAGESEFGFGTSEQRRQASPPELQAYFEQMNAPRS